MAQSTLRIPDALDKGTVIALRRYNPTKLHHWGMLLPIAQPDLNWKRKRGGGRWSEGEGGGGQSFPYGGGEPPFRRP